MALRVKPFNERTPSTNAVLHENPLINRVLQNRGVKSSNEIEYRIKNLIPPSKMKGIHEASEIIAQHIMAQSKILIIGDYDCDGATSTSIAVEGLRMLGAKDVNFLIPDRIKHGYGLSPKLIEIAEPEKPDLIITVDNGIAAFEGAKAVRNMKHPCQLVITDHHLPAESGKVPEADAIVNPSQPGCTFPSKNIAGCGVMFYTIIGARAYMDQNNIFEKIGQIKPSLNPLLDLVALGTIADVVPLDYNNRVLVQMGLNWINAGRVRPGLRAILDIANKEIGQITSQDFGFAVGPRINAAGRLDDMSIGIQCLLEKDHSQATQFATRLDNLNANRKEIEGDMLENALNDLNGRSFEQDGVIVYKDNWHEGVVGILASRIKERTDRPTICFTDTHELADAKRMLQEGIQAGLPKEDLDNLQKIVDNSDVKGSARSIPGIHLKHVLDGMYKKNPEMFSKFGGHAMAAGVSIPSGQFEAFKLAFDHTVSKHITPEMAKGSVIVDIDCIDPELMTLENAEMIENMAVWGQHFEFPTFSQKFNIINKRPIGNGTHLSLEIQPLNSDKVFKAVAFSCIDQGQLPVDEYVEASFKLSVNEFRGRKSLQLMIDHLQDPELVARIELDESRASINTDEKPSYETLDGASSAQKDLMQQDKLSNNFVL